jgi:type IV secretion system protein TrbL
MQEESEVDLGGLDAVLNAFDAATAHWSATLLPYALSLFWLLAGIEWTYTFIRLVLSPRVGFGEIINVVVFKFLYLSFVYWLIQKSSVLLPAIVASFQKAGGAAGNITALHPSAFLGAGLRVALAILSSLDLSGVLFDDLGTQMAVWGAFAVLVLFSLMAASITLTLVESFLLISGVVQFMLPFAACRWTASLAQSALATVFRVGAKLMVTYMVASVLSNLLTHWADVISAAGQVSPLDVFAFIGSLVVSCVLVFVLPSRLAGYLVPPTLHIGLSPNITD